MTAPKDINNNNEELVTIEGLKVKKYQMDFMKIVAGIYNNGDLNQFLTETLLLGSLIRSHGHNLGLEQDRFKPDGYEDRIEKVITITGAPAEVLLDNLEENQPYEISDHTNSDNLPVISINRRIIGKVSET